LTFIAHKYIGCVRRATDTYAGVRDSAPLSTTLVGNTAPTLASVTDKSVAEEASLSFTITGAHPKAKKSYMIGLDYLLLTPAE
jgi:hypothetical protein